uniref:TIL domain-containing protein n=1 Tax=Anopheles melas TaxID=34690 RepID=A0A182TWE7_9DIPT
MARLRVLALVLLVSCIVVIASAEKTSADVEAEHGETVPATPEPSTTEAMEEETPPPKIECSDPREVYNECGSSCDDRTCEDMGRGDHLACTKHCVEGCFCRNGYVRDKQDRCIPSYRCGKGSL